MSRRTQARGSVVLELVVLTPLLLAFADLAILGGRLTESQSQVDGAAASAARAASIERIPAAAIEAAKSAATATLAQQHVTCISPGITVETTAFHRGGWVAVDVQCSVSLSDLGWLPLPGTRTLTSRSVSAIDVYEGG